MVEGDGNTALHLAASNRHMEVVRLLVAKGANVKAKNVDGQYPADLATEGAIRTILKRHMEMVSVILRSRCML